MARIIQVAVAITLITSLVGCFAPSRANIELRKQNQQLQNQIDQLNRVHQADLAKIETLQSPIGALSTLPEFRLEKLYTTHGLRFGKLTGSDEISPGKQGLKIYIVPVDASGQDLKAAGTFTVEAFDLAEPENPLVGQWHFNLEQAKEAWQGNVMFYNYVLPCPWQTLPLHPELTVKVTFVDELTQRTFAVQKVVKVNLPASPTQPTAQP